MSAKSDSGLSQKDWTEAALAAMATDGVAGINIEGLAKVVGATKGSFYHHFKDRQALLDAALGRWEAILSEDIADAKLISDPHQRLIAFSTGALDKRLDGFVDLALAVSADVPAVAATLGRTQAIRLRFVSAALEEVGISPSEALERAVSGLATYLGLYQMQVVPDNRIGAEEFRAQIVRLVKTMITN